MCSLEGSIDCTVADVLKFMSGTDTEPPLGFPYQPKVTFLYGSEKLCTAGTCDIRLCLPTAYDDYDKFKCGLILSFKGNDGFGGGV